MAYNLGNQTNIDKSNLAAYPNGQIKDNDGTGDGTPINRVTASDIWMFFDKLMRLAQIAYASNFDNETNGYQFVNAIIALAGKNDFILPLTTSSSILQIPTATNILLTNERMLVQAGQDYAGETQIKGTGATLLTVTLGSASVFKNGDYLMLVKTVSGITLVRLATADNLTVLAGGLGFLKAAGNSDELAGTATNEATTPASNLYAFGQRVTNPTYAAPFYATPAAPGLLSAADKTAINGFVSKVLNKGSFSGVDVGGGTIGAYYTVTGDIATAQITNIGSAYYPYGGYSIVLITVNHTMTNTNYFVRYSIESNGTIIDDFTILTPVTKNLSATTFSFALQESQPKVQNLIIHLEVVSLN